VSGTVDEITFVLLGLDIDVVVLGLIVRRRSGSRLHLIGVKSALLR
jgi:hypothetical protein